MEWSCSTLELELEPCDQLAQGAVELKGDAVQFWMAIGAHVYDGHAIQSVDFSVKNKFDKYLWNLS